MGKLTLAYIQALAASPDYGGRGFLQPSSAVLGLSAALFLSDLTLWQGAGYKLTDGEIDDIQAMIAQLEEDLMVTGDMYTVDKCQVTNSAGQPVSPSTTTNVGFDTELYDPEGMHSNVAQNSRIHAVRSGLHIISANVTWELNVIGYRQLQLLKFPVGGPSSLPLITVLSMPIVGSGRATNTIICQDEAEEGDFYFLRAYQTSPITIDIIAANDAPRFAVVRL